MAHGSFENELTGEGQKLRKQARKHSEPAGRRTKPRMDMATCGLYVQRLSTGDVHSVQIKDDAGMEWPVDPSVYITRGYEPPIDSLPDLEEYDGKRTV